MTKTWKIHWIPLALLIALYISGCQNNIQGSGDYREGVNYTYHNEQLEYLSVVTNNKYMNSYYFYKTGMIRARVDSANNYWIYEPEGNLVNLMYYKLLPNKTHYCKYYTLDSSCQLEYTDGVKRLTIRDTTFLFSDTCSRCSHYPTDFSLIIRRDSLEIHSYTYDHTDLKMATYPIK